MYRFSPSLFLLLMATACSFDGNTDRGSSALPEDANPDVDSTSSADATVDGDGNPIPVCQLWSPQHFQPCDLPDPQGPIDLLASASPWVYNTGTGTLTDMSGTVTMPPSIEMDQGGGLIARVVSADELTLESGAVLRVVGTHPLIVASFGTIEVAGTVNIDSRRGAANGAGANPLACNGDPAISGEDGNSGSGGGGGGGFQGTGASGGEADANNGGQGTKAGGAGQSGLVTPPLVVRGGCSGAKSGTGNGQAGAGGAGGGAIQLSAFEGIKVTGTIHAGGAGGSSGPFASACGGGGGGSGGFIGLDAAEVDISNSTLAANGGGGGEATDLSTSGVDGQNGRPNANPASGGADPSCGTDGSNGSAGATLGGAQVGSLDNCGGGGGGGGAGYILVHSSTYVPGGAVTSPAPIVTQPIVN